MVDGGGWRRWVEVWVDGEGRWVRGCGGIGWENW